MPAGARPAPHTRPPSPAPARRWPVGMVWALVFLLGINWLTPRLVPLRWVYHYRMDYEILKHNMAGVDAVIEQIAAEIRREGLRDYVILLGDSVTYSGPGGPEQSVGYWLEQTGREAGRPLRVFNLALPAMQTGDMYVIVRKLQRRGVPLPRVAVNLVYAGFVARQPDPPAVFWLADELRRVDPEAWGRWREHLAANGRVPPVTLPGLVNRHVLPRVALARYRDFVREGALGLRRTQEVYDTRVWSDKPALLAQDPDGPELRRLFDPAPLDLGPDNPQVYFLERMTAALASSGQIQPPIFYISPVNPELTRQQTAHPGYRDNLSRIAAWFEGRPVGYADLSASLDQSLFADRLHMTPEGYRVLAGMLWERLDGLPPGPVAAHPADILTLP